MSNVLYKPINYFKSERPSDAGQWRGGYPDDKVYNMDFDSASLYVASSQYRQSAANQNFNFQNDGFGADEMGITVGVWVEMCTVPSGSDIEYIAQCVDSNGFNGFGIYWKSDMSIAVEHIDFEGTKVAKASLQFNADNLPGMFKYFSFNLTQPGWIAPPASDIFVFTNTGTMSFGTAPTRMDPNAKRQLTIGADYQGNTPFNGLVHSLAIWNVGSGSWTHRQVYNDGNGYAADLRVPWGEYTSYYSDQLVSWYRLGADSNRTWVDFGSNRINLTEGSAGEDDIVSCAPMGGCLTLETVGSQRFATDGAWPLFNKDLNFGNDGKWTILTCTGMRPYGAASNYLWDIAPRGVSLNRVVVSTGVALAGKITVVVYSNTGAVGKIFTSSNYGATSQYPQLLGQTFDSSKLDGASTGLLKLFKNGIEDPAPTKTVNGNCVVDNTDLRVIDFNAAQGGGALYATQDLYWMAIWDSVLAPEEIRQIYNKGFHSIFKLDEDYGDYVSSSSLVQWYKCGSGSQSAEVGGVWNSNKVLAADGGIGATTGTPVTNITLIKNSTSMSGTMDTTPVATLTPLRGGNPGPQIVMANGQQAGTAAAQSLGLSNLWTISAWASSVTNPGAAVLKLVAALQSVAAPDLNINRVTLGILGGAPDVFQVNIWNRAGALIKSYSFGDNIAANCCYGGMFHLAVTFDAKANTLRVYANGMEDTAPAKSTDVDSSSQTFTDSARFLYLAGAETLAGTEEELIGALGNCLFWDSVLSPNEIRQVYRSGPVFDPFNNRYGYASSRNLVHCYRWDNHDGVTMNSVGEDRVGSYTANLEFTAGMTLFCCLQQGGYGTILRP